MLRLTYFAFPGLAEKIRLAFAVAGLAYEDERIPSSEEGYAEARRRTESPCT